MFREYQSAVSTVPREWYQEKQKRQVAEVMNEEGQTMVELFVVDFKVETLRLFSDVDTIPMGLQSHGDLVTQLKNCSSSFLGCKVGSVWKVNKVKEKIKRVTEFADLMQTPQRIF